MTKAPDSYDGHDATFNGKVDAVVDLREPGSPKLFHRKDGAGKDGDFIQGTVGIRTRNGLLLISALDLANQECFDVTYRVEAPAERDVDAKDEHTHVTVDDNQRDIAALGFINGQRTALEDIEDDQYDTAVHRVKATGSQAARIIALVVDKMGAET